MKKHFLGFLFFQFIVLKLMAQQGLEGIIVEKYYISTEDDTLNSLYYGKLAPGSVTYRIFADLLPEYTFQAAYGTPTHPLSIQTSTTFFNHTSLGNFIPNVIPARNIHENTLMLDSWLSVGAGAEGFYGVPKTEDDSIKTIFHNFPYLHGDSPEAGFPLTQRDGLKEVKSLPRPTFFAIDSAVLVFRSKVGNVFQTTNGAWACMGKGAKGLDSLGTNKVLIAQITTDGDFDFELNLQIGTPDRKSQNYVAKNPVENEILLPSLIYKSEAGNRKHKKKKNKTS